MQVVAVVAQTSEPVRRYIEETGLPFNILIDESRDVLKAYGVWHRVGSDAWNIARPALFLIDRTGAIRYSFIGDRQDEFPSHEEILGGATGGQEIRGIRQEIRRSGAPFLKGSKARVEPGAGSARLSVSRYASRYPSVGCSIRSISRGQHGYRQ